MSRDFNPVSAALWASWPPGLDSDARLLLFYFMTSPHQNSSGCCRIREGYALADLKWEPARYRMAFSEVVAADLVVFDPETEEVYVQSGSRHKGNIPTNKDHAKGTMKIVANIDSDDLREQVEADFQATSWGQKATETPEATAARDLGSSTLLERRGQTDDSLSTACEQSPDTRNRTETGTRTRNRT